MRGLLRAVTWGYREGIVAEYLIDELFKEILRTVRERRVTVMSIWSISGQLRDETFRTKDDSLTTLRQKYVLMLRPM